MTTFHLPNYKNSLPHGGVDLVEKFVEQSIPGGKVLWRGNLGRSGRAGIGIAYGYEPSEAEREHAWSVARAVMDLLPREEPTSAPVKIKSRCLDFDIAEAAALARYGGAQNMVPRHAGAE
jgi:hypothetical protein